MSAAGRPGSTVDAVSAHMTLHRDQDPVTWYIVHDRAQAEAAVLLCL